jgi:hypothetical protein
MKRDWRVIENILTHIEDGDLNQYVKKQQYLTDLEIDDKDYFGHIEILIDAGLIKHCSVTRCLDGSFREWHLESPFITMQGHDLLDAMRDKKLWTRIKAKSVQCGVLMSWEFIKAAIPIVLREIIERP